STNAGQNFTLIPPSAIEVATPDPFYPDGLLEGLLGGAEAWTGQIATNDWTQVTVDLRDILAATPLLQRKEIVIGFGFSKEDDADVGPGWYLDDFQIGDRSTLK
ncbi:MAG: hypothetical protein ACYTFT_18245, partial [Planctomycetota bacterium]